MFLNVLRVLFALSVASVVTVSLSMAALTISGDLGRKIQLSKASWEM